MLRKSGAQRRQPPLWRRCRSLRQIKQVHALMVLRGFLSDPSALRELLFASAVAVRGAIAHAYLVFDQIPRPDLFMYNTLIRGAAHTAAPRDAVSLYARMARRGSCGGVRPDKITFPFVLRACTAMGAGGTGAQVHAHVVKAGCESDAFVRNALIGMHASCGELGVASALFDGRAREDAVAWSAMITGCARRGDIVAARKLFDECPVKDHVSWNVMITAYAKRGEMAPARVLFNRIPERDVVSWNAMISGHVRCGSHVYAMELFEQMQRMGQKPDVVTMLSLLSACADSGDIDVGRRLHSSLSEMFLRTGFTVILGNALIDMYAKCGSMKSALQVFWVMRDKDVSTWNSIIGGLALHGHVLESIDVFKKMLKEKVRPDEITFVAVLIACSHGGMVDKGREYFNLMQHHYRIEPNVKHYGCMVDMLGRAGLLKEAFEFIDTMKVEPNSVIWRTLLGACRVHGEIELAEHANRQLLKARNDESGDYVLLSNIYASAGEWSESEKMRKLMDDSGVNKQAGRTVVDGSAKDLMQSFG
ncbi:pentatricopeptide repeat-containing protein At5g15300 [Brachypodium distachyon]|nr:pentatricopeptide repeat-containing protein At5g15300 [Brachypodium distachyon]|eukprot:XP_003558728.1 pentatricopeptide repeat-containing protein At5g15300 [Brachypodium distachyon]